MSVVQRQAHRLAWQERAEHGRDQARRPVWCIDTWTRSGLITSPQSVAAHRLWRDIEIGYAPVGAVGGPYVDGGDGDCHGAVLGAIYRRRSVLATHQWMRARLDRGKLRRAIYTRVFDEGQPQCTAKQLLAHCRAGHDTARIVRHLGHVLDLLIVRQEMLDREREDWACKVRSESGTSV